MSEVAEVLRVAFGLEGDEDELVAVLESFHSFCDDEGLDPEDGASLEAFITQREGS